MGNATKASAEGLDALETFVAPAVLEATRVVCLAPPRQARVRVRARVRARVRVRVRVRVGVGARVRVGQP